MAMKPWNRVAVATMIAVERNERQILFLLSLIDRRKMRMRVQSFAQCNLPSWRECIGVSAREGHMFGKRLIAAAVSVAMLTGVTWYANAAELGQQCDGISGIACDSGLWCDLQPGLCDGVDISGTCVKIPSVCPQTVKPVCACGNWPYTNDCERQKSQAAKSHNGKC
jgi:hypothetical protein